MTPPALYADHPEPVEGQLRRWAAKEVAQRTGNPRAYRGPYPDRSGPTMAHATRVADLADLLKMELSHER